MSRYGSHQTMSSISRKHGEEEPKDGSDSDRSIRQGTRGSRPISMKVRDRAPDARSSAWQRLVFADPVALRYLEEDPCTMVEDRHRPLAGYELYIVEQWACSRVHPTFVITTYTGLSQHKIFVGVLRVPVEEDEWSPRLRIYVKALSRFHARKKSTALGTLMVTNLSSFPSALTVIAVPGGDVRLHRDNFIVNENMKRLGCSGRAGLNLSPPTAPTRAKFRQLYHTSDAVGIEESTMELVRLCQIALVLFTKLSPEYADGLLCDETEKAINDWWTEIGLEYFSTEPNDGVLGPMTVSALMGMLLGARNRLSAYGAPVAKDVFDLRATKRGLAHFQKWQKIPKTRRLDRHTLNRLHRVTSKAANSEGWAMPKAVKSTVAELGGRGGEMVMGMVGGKDKAGIAEVESTDISTFVASLGGERCKWLWHGKPRKTAAQDFFTNLADDDDVMISGDEGLNHDRGNRKDPATDPGPSSRTDATYPDSPSSHGNLDHVDKDQALRKAVLKTVSGKMSDARSGLGRIKDAVGISGFRGHTHRHSKDFSIAGSADYGRSNEVESHYTDDEVAHSLQRRSSQDTHSPAQNHPGQLITSTNNSSLHEPINSEIPLDKKRSDFVELEASCLDNDSQSNVESQELLKDTMSEASPILKGPGTTGNLHEPSALLQFRGSLTSRSTQSLCQITVPICTRAQRLLPRSSSFSLVDGILHTFQDHTNLSQGSLSAEPSTENERFLSIKSQAMSTKVNSLGTAASVLSKETLTNIKVSRSEAAKHKDELNSIYYHQLEDHDTLRRTTNELLAEERASLTDALRDIEVLGAKLEYELNALASKVEDVEDSVLGFEGQVLELEDRAKGLSLIDVNKEAWFWNVLRFFSA